MKNLILVLFCLSLHFNDAAAQLGWEHTDGPFGSLQSTIYSNDQYAFVPGGEFLFRTSDGFTWEKIESPVSASIHVYHDTIIQIPYNSNPDSLRLLLSFDNGDTWVQKDLPVEIGYTNDFVMTPHGIYIAETNDNLLFRSTDLGDSWESVSVPQEFRVLEAHENKLFIASSLSLWRTDAYGGNWENITPPRPNGSYIGDIIATNSHLLVTSEDYFFHSHDDGQTWETENLKSGNAHNKLTLVDNQVYFSANLQLLRSDDYGISWDTLAMTGYNTMISATGFNGLYLSTTFNKGVFRWDDASQSLIENNDGLSKGYVYDLAVGNDKIWAACGNGVFAYDVPTQIWSNKMNLPLPDTEYDFISANEHGWVVVSEFNATKFYYTKNNGITWQTQPLSHVPDINTIFKTQLIGEVLYLVSEYYLYRSANMGMSWEYVDVGFINSEIVALNGTLYMASSDSLYSSIDNGVNWDAIKPPISIEQLFVFADLLYALGYNQDYVDELYTSTDGVEWAYASDGFPDDYSGHPLYGMTNDFFFRDASNHYAFLGRHGHYTSSDASIQWSSLSTSKTGNSYVIHDDVLYLGNHGVYKLQIEDPYITAVDDITNTSNEPFIISPNPAYDLITITSHTTINLYSPIRIYSSDGKVMKSIVPSHDARQIDIIISDLPDGFYFVSLQGENGRAVNSFVKVR